MRVICHEQHMTRRTMMKLGECRSSPWIGGGTHLRRCRCVDDVEDLVRDDRIARQVVQHARWTKRLVPNESLLSCEVDEDIIRKQGCTNDGE